MMASATEFPYFQQKVEEAIDSLRTMTDRAYRDRITAIYLLLDRGQGLNNEDAIFLVASIAGHVLDAKMIDWD